MIKYIPNVLSVLRILLTVPFLFFLFYARYEYAFWTLFTAAVTDGLDGWLARALDCQSTLGKVLDPMGDKILVVVSVISLAFIGKLPVWFVLLVFFRDLAITLGVIIWCYFLDTKFDFKPSYLSKINTTLQLILIGLCIFELAFFQLSFPLTHWLIILTTITTVASFFDYGLMLTKKIFKWT